MEVTEKDTEKNSSNMELYYLFLDKDITDIYSYGFSFSEVDMPYIRDICKSIDTLKITWHLSDFDTKEKQEEYKRRIIACGFRGKFTTYGISEKSKKKIKLKTKKYSPYNQYIRKQKKYMGVGRFALQQFILDYNTIGYVRPNKQWKQSTWLKIPRLIWIYVLVLFEFVFNKLFKKKN